MAGVIGFDFGTTNSLISVIEGGRCIPLLDNGMPHPSVVCYQGDRVVVGRRAKERLANLEVGVVGNVVRSPKSLLGEHKVYVDGVARNPRDVVAAVVSHVRAHARESLSGDFDRAVVTIPVDMDGRRRRELREAFRLAGMSILQFVHEPHAALYGHLRGQREFEDALRRLNRELILVFDWGGGTLDLTLCQIVDGVLLQLKSEGTSAVGGDVIDNELRNEIVRRTLQARGISSSIPQQVDASKRLLERAERAKIELSSKSSFTVYVPDYFEGAGVERDIEYKLSRHELEEIVGDKVNRGIQRIHELLDKAGLTPASIALCLATGGMVNMPLIRTRLQEIFDPQRLRVSERGATVISEGAAWIANDRTRLSLAKNVEVLIARRDYFPAVRAGQPMPREGEVNSQPLTLFCTDPRDGVAKIQIVSPARPQRVVQVTDPRDVIGTLSVKVDAKARPFLERIELQLSIDDNLILHANAKSLLANDSDAVEIHGLEFGLALPLKSRGPDDGRATKPNSSAAERRLGSVELRSNVAATVDDVLVPGDLLYQINPQYFNLTFNRPPQQQEDERLYYEPCAVCKRPSNHPQCRCATDGIRSVPG